MAWPPRGAVTALFLLPCAGCSSLIGLDEFKPAEDGDAGGSAGSGGDAGSNAQGGNGAGGAGAQGGSAQAGTGAGAQGGNAGSGGVVTACSGQPDGQACSLDGADAGAMDAGADAADAGAASERRICLNQQCVVSRCGDGYADDGRGEACDDKKNGNQTDGCRDDCQYTCTTNDDCVAALKCVLSQCNLTTHTCGPQTADTCDDGDACTADSCNSSTGACVNTFIDEDGDGYSGKTCSASGAYADKGGDCLDSSSVTGSASIFPGAMTYYTTPHSISGQKPFDYDCDGVEERQYPDTYNETTCTSGWKLLFGVPIPGCGESADYYVYIRNSQGNCLFYPPVRTITQACR